MHLRRPLSQIFGTLERHWDFTGWWTFDIGKHWMVAIIHAKKKDHSDAR